MADSYYCEKCHKTMGPEQFYGSNNTEKYPDGKLKQCKKCITMHVDNFNPDTYLWILQECDVPYIATEWNKILASYASKRDKVTGMTIIGRYLSKMKLKQHKEYRWKDSDYLQEIEQKKIKETMERQGYDVQQINDVITKGTFEMPEGELMPPPATLIGNPSSMFADAPPEDYFAAQTADFMDEFVPDLSDEERTYLCLKWGKTYKPEEWVRLEQLYEEMMGSYDIQSAGHIDTLKLICKTSLKANQLLDIGDVDGAQKMIKMYDGLMKSGKFTAAQNKGENGEYVDSISELVELCEKQGYIERFYIAEPNDKVDETIRDMQRYTKTLIEKETNLSELIEQAVKQNMKEDENESEDTDEIIFDDVDEVEKELSDQDYVDYYNFKEEDGQFDLVKMLGGDDE